MMIDIKPINFHAMERPCFRSKHGPGNPMRIKMIAVGGREKERVVVWGGHLCFPYNGRSQPPTMSLPSHVPASNLYGHAPPPQLNAPSN